MTRRQARMILVVAGAVTGLLTVSLPAGATVRSGGPAPIAAVERAACGTPAPGHATCFARFSTPGAAQPASTMAGARAAAGPAAVGKPTRGYGPADIASMYGTDATRGAGQTIAIVDAYDDPHAESDLAAYRSAWGLPACNAATGCFRKVNQRGGSAPPVRNGGWGLEISLDLDAVSAACPNCSILLVEADTNTYDDLGQAVNEATKLGAKIVSNSYGGSEFTGILGLGRKYYTHAGVAMVVATGDTAFGPANFPASWTRSIAVGGTSVTKTATGWSHTAWSGTSSGCSAWVAKPAWQKDGHCLMRTIADVSALADPDTGLAVYDTFDVPATLGIPNGWIVGGGTSLASPLVAAMIGLAGNAATMTTARPIYTHAGSLLDVTTGSNGVCGGDYLCNATNGYDGPTGMGTPRGTHAL